MKSFPNLEAFLKTLRSEGIPVGLREITRLHQLFHQQPELDRQTLKDSLSCLLAKKAVERRKFNRLFEIWIEKAGDHGKTERADSLPPEPVLRNPKLPKETSPPPKSSKEKKRYEGNRIRPIVWLLAATIFALGVAVNLVNLRSPKPIEPPPPLIKTEISEAEQSKTGTSSVDTGQRRSPESPPVVIETEIFPVDPVEKYWTWVPTVAPFQSNTALFWPMLGLSIAAMGLAGLLWRHFKRAVELPVGLSAPTDGPEWLPMLAPESTGSELINSNQVRNAVWSVGRFVSEQYTEKLDLQRTVEATADSGGMPHLHRRRAVYDREVWLWIDEQSQHPAVPRLAAELQTSLLRAGLSARLAWFSGLPDRLTWEQGHIFDPLVWDGYRGSVIVVILSEGEDFIYAWQSAHRLDAFKQMLYAFGQWPRLAFVDFSAGHDVLNSILERYKITHIGPNDLAAYVGGQAGQFKQLTPDWSNELRLWAAAACLRNDALDEDTAYALHRHLGLSVPASEIKALWKYGQDQAGRLTWTTSQRTELLRWLASVEQLDPDKAIPDKSLLGSALSFWRQHFAHQAHKREKLETGFKPWRQTPAQRELMMQQGLIDLWDRPVSAANQLFKLFKSEQGAFLKNQILKALGSYFPADTIQSAHHNERRAIILPWRFQTLPAKIRLILAEMGLAGGTIKPQSQLQPTAKLGLALGLLAGVALSSLISALSSPGTFDAPYFVAAKEIFDDPVFRRFTLRHWQALGAGRFRYTVGSPKRLQTATMGFGQSAGLNWRWTELENVEVLDGAQLWHAGTLPQPIRPCSDNWPRRSLVVIGFDPQDPSAKRLAIRLLDKGSADVVLLGLDWAKHLDRLTGGKDAVAELDQLLVILAEEATSPTRIEFSGKQAIVRTKDLINLVRSFNFAGTKALKEHWGDNQSDVVLWGGPEIEEYKGMKLVKVCGGTFSMGTLKADLSAGDWYKNENPRHTITLDTFKINRTEVTEGQFSSALNSKTPGKYTQPKNLINWTDALAFCQRYQLDLPTEAQWEYAARAGSLTPWSFGSEQSMLKYYASTENLSDVASKRPNPLGLFDMHGYLYEWTKDCYDQSVYKNRHQKTTTIEPLNHSLSCSDRSLRGGSYYDSAEVLRSAVRDGFWPGFVDGLIGFRCVRAPRRQP